MHVFVCVCNLKALIGRMGKRVTNSTTETSIRLSSQALSEYEIEYTYVCICMCVYVCAYQAQLYACCYMFLNYFDI